MKHFTQGEVQEALAHAAAGGQALPTHRTIACIRVHRDNHSTWPTWANVRADEVERLWAREEQTRQALVELKRYAVFHGLLIGECVAWNPLKAAYDVETPPEPDAAAESG